MRYQRCLHAGTEASLSGITCCHRIRSHVLLLTFCHTTTPVLSLRATVTFELKLVTHIFSLTFYLPTVHSFSSFFFPLSLWQMLLVVVTTTSIFPDHKIVLLLPQVLSSLTTDGLANQYLRPWSTVYRGGPRGRQPSHLTQHLPPHSTVYFCSHTFTLIYAIMDSFV